MAKAKARNRYSAPTLAGWRRALVFMVLTAFVLQSYIVQTHIHFAPADLALLAGDAAAKNAPQHDRYPANDDPANCPICQEILHSGHFVTPAAAALLLPTLAVSTIALVDQPLPVVAAPSHSWRGRAPPHS
jgi:hypothetical protein